MTDAAFSQLIQAVMETAVNTRSTFVIGIAQNGEIYERPIGRNEECPANAATILLRQFPTLAQTGLLIAALVDYGGTMTNPRRGRRTVKALDVYVDTEFHVSGHYMEHKLTYSVENDRMNFHDLCESDFTLDGGKTIRVVRTLD